VRPDVSEPEALGEKLRGWRAGGQASLLEIAAAETRFPGDVTRRYLQHHIRYRLGAREKRALAEYARLLHKHGMVGGGSYEDPRWV
jgi:predicted solute-binding protein